MKKSKILSLILAMVFIFGAICPGLGLVIADTEQVDPVPVEEAEKVDEEKESKIPVITEFAISFDDETGEQLPLFVLSAAEGAQYEDIEFPKAVKAKLDDADEFASVDVFEWKEKGESKFIPTFDENVYAVADGVVFPYGIVEINKATDETNEEIDNEKVAEKSEAEADAQLEEKKDETVVEEVNTETPQMLRANNAKASVGDSRVYRGERTRVSSTLFKWKKDWTYHGTSSFQVNTTFHAGDAVGIDIHYFKDSSGNKINDIQGYCLEQRWPGPNTENSTESGYGVIAEVKTLEEVYGATNANKLRAILDNGYPMTTKINGVSWTSEEARQITQMAIRCFLANISDDAAYPAFSSSNIDTYIEDTKNGTAMAAIAFLVDKATRSERFEPQLTLSGTVISLTKSGSNYVGSVNITTNMTESDIAIIADALTALGGSASISNGKLNVTVPENKINDADGITVTLKYSNPKRVVDSHAYFYEPSRRRPKSTRQALLGVSTVKSYDTRAVTLQAPRSGDIEIIKKSSLGAQIDGNDCYSVAGAEFELRDSNGNKVGNTMITNANGYARQNDIPAGTYTLVETKAPKGHEQTNRTQSVTVGGPITSIEWTNEAANDPVPIRIKKVDADGNAVPQGDATFEGAEFTVKYYDTLESVSWSTTPEKTWIVKADEDGIALLDNEYKISGDAFYTNSNGNVIVPIGTLLIRETKAPEGYNISNTVHTVTITQDGFSQNVVVSGNTISGHELKINDKVVEGSFSILKLATDHGADGSIPSEEAIANGTPEKDIEFEIRLKSSNQKIKTIKTDADGKASSGTLPYGTYIVKQITDVPGRTKVADFEVTIPDDNGHEYILENVQKYGNILVIKKDGNTGKVITAAGIKFNVYDSNNNKISRNGSDVFVTDDTGNVLIPGLVYGNYTIVEIETIAPYILDSTPHSVTVDETHLNSENNVLVSIDNNQGKGKIEIHKYGDVFSKVSEETQNGENIKKPVFETKYLAGVTLEIYATEDIYVNGEKVVANGEKVATLVTNGTGPVTTDTLYLGSYRIHEASMPAGYMPIEDVLVSITGNGTQSVVIKKAELTNVHQNSQFKLEKLAEEITVDEETGNVTITFVHKAGFLFGLYANETLTALDGTQIQAGDAIAAVKSDSNGNVIFSGKLPIANYYVKEISAPEERYILDENEYPISNKNQDNTVQTINLNVVNEPIKNEYDKAWAQIVKVDAESGQIVKIAGAKFDIFDADGNKVDFVETNEDGIAQLRMPLEHGKTYTVKETKAPYGYTLNSEAMELVIVDANLEKIGDYEERYTLRFANTRVKGKITVEKTGDMITSATEEQVGEFTVMHPELTTEYLSGAKFKIVAKEDIVHNGEVIFHAGDEVAVLTTDNGAAKLEDMYLGKYTISEIEAPAGYVLVADTTDFELKYEGQNTKIVVKDFAFGNELRELNVQLKKLAEIVGIVTDSDGNVDVVYEYVDGEGFTFGLYNAFDIKNVNTGAVIIPANSLVSICVSDENGLVNFSGKYPVGNYYIKEIATLPKYQVNDDFRYDINNTVSDETVPTIDFALDEPVKNNYEYAMVKVIKTDMAGSEGLPGATLEIHDEEGNVIYRHVTDEDGGLEEVKLIPGTYTLHEIFAPNGYALSEEIVTFTVNEDGTVEGEAVMKDDVTRFSFYKIDEKGNKLSGAEFTMYDEEGNVYAVAESDENGIVTFENMLVGKYIIKETKALPDYQLSSETIELDVTDQWLNSNSYTDGGELMYSIMNYEIITTGRGLTTGAKIAIIAGSMALIAMGCIGFVFMKRKKNPIA